MTNNRFTPTWTRYICTIGPSSHSKEVMGGLIEAGASIFRSNFAHAQYDEYRQRKAWLDELNAELGTKVEMQADLQRRNIRLGLFNNDRSGSIEMEPNTEDCCYT